jgi:hypothetical protein
MWIEIKSDIFTSNDYKNFSFLLNLISEKPSTSKNTKAKLYVEYDLIVETELFNRLDAIDREFIEDSFKQYFYEDDAQIKCIVSNQNSTEKYNLEEAIAFLKEPFWIILENNKNDENLIKSIIFYFDNTEDEYLKDCIRNRWVQFDNAGGCGNVKNLIKGRLKSFENLVAKNGSNANKYYNAFVVLDSDRDFQGQEIKQDYSSLIDYLNEIHVKFHILEKRAMENYMPDEVLFDIRNNKSNSNDQNDIKCVNWINVYTNLNVIQKDYLKYSGHDLFTNLTIEAQALYRNQLTINFDILQTGINYRDNRPGIETEERRFKNAFPKLFLESPLVNKKTLNQRCGSDELQRIFNSINNLL